MADIIDFPNKTKEPYIIAIDFDDTICSGGWPDIENGTLITSTAYKILEQIKKKPNTSFILWTCRDNEKLADAMWFIRQHKLPIALFNTNHPSTDDWLLGGKNKIFAHEYWDDRAVKI